MDKLFPTSEEYEKNVVSKLHQIKGMVLYI